MKKIINGKKYDTDTAHIIAYSKSGGNCFRDFHYLLQELYQKGNGEFFFYVEGAAGTAYGQPAEGGGRCGGCHIIPTTEDDAKKFAEKNLDGDEYEVMFGMCDE